MAAVDREETLRSRLGRARGATGPYGWSGPIGSRTPVTPNPVHHSRPGGCRALLLHTKQSIPFYIHVINCKHRLFLVLAFVMQCQLVRILHVLLLG